MKVLFVDINTTGHHLIYMKSLMSMNDVEAVVAVPKKTDELFIRQYEIPELARSVSFSEYRQTIKRIKEIIAIEQPDLIHFLSGDMLYRYFGLYLNCFSNTVVTFHHMSFSLPRMVSYYAIFKKISFGVVHTSYLKKKLNRIGIRNAEHVEYPCFYRPITVNTDEVKDKYCIPKSCKTLLAFGETRYDKGLDILLNALNYVTAPFHLIIAGAEKEITGEEINRLTLNYSEKVSLLLGYVDEHSMHELFAISDIVVLPYRKKFTGASGPLTTGVLYKKTIIGPKSGSLESIIINNDLGYVFECNSVKSLSKTIEDALQHENTFGGMEAYLKILSVGNFLNNYSKIYEQVNNK